MSAEKALVITSIANDQHWVLKKFAQDCADRNVSFILIGDTKSPAQFQLPGCDFWSVDKQLALPFEIAQLIPTKHYARKNIGYLIAIKNGAKEIIETDDDNIPLDGFWNDHQPNVDSHLIEDTGWLNVYSYFTKKNIWPRGLPLDEILKEKITLGKSQLNYCPIHQGLADENPDVDAVYRLTYPLPITFEIKNNIALGKNSWCPFNTQNTYWFKEAFALMYLPSYCSFRMTDIWRSFVAQRIAWECGWNILFHSPNVYQERNEHNLMKDFEDEITGYMNNKTIADELQKLKLKKGVENIFDNLILCYQKLIDINVIDKKEMPLVEAWIKDFKSIA